MYTPEEAQQFDLIIKTIKPSGAVGVGWLATQISYSGKTLYPVINIMQAEELVHCEATSINSAVKLLKRGYEVEAAGGWLKYVAKQEEEKRLQGEKESEEEERAKAIHSKTLLEIQKVNKELAGYELQTKMFEKQLLKLERESADSAKQTILMEAQIESLQTGNKYWYLPYVFSGIAILISAAALILELCKYLKR